MRITGKSLLALAVLAGLIAFFGTVEIQKGWTQVKGPADFEFAGSGGGKVVFSHETHTPKNPKCTDCHTKIFKTAKGQRSTPKMADMNNGQSCGTCHNGKVAFSVKEQANCEKCHKKS